MIMMGKMKTMDGRRSVTPQAADDFMGGKKIINSKFNNLMKTGLEQYQRDFI